jgi:hypothetical protein
MARTFATLLLAALPIILGTAHPASAQMSRPIAGATVPNAPWAIAGIRLGMTPREVADAMKAAGYRLDYRYPGRSWQGELASQVSFLRGIRIPGGADVTRKEDYQKGQEAIQVTYAVNPSGPYVARVNYKIESAAIDAERFRAAALSRYGRPSIKWDWESLYCLPAERQCSRTSSLITNQLPNLTVHVMDGLNRTLELRQGQQADRAGEALVKAEVERLYPKKDRPSF